MSRVPTAEGSASKPLLLACAVLATVLAAGPKPVRAACSAQAAEAGWTAPQVVGNDPARDFRSLVAGLSHRDLVFVGERHDRYDHHLNQLEILCALSAGQQPLAVGMEYFQRPFQDALDRYIGEHHDLDRLLRESEYFSRWRFDARLYAPILEFAAQRGIRLVALNPSTEIVDRVSRHGPDGLEGEQAARLRTAMAQASANYRERLRSAFEAHPGHENRDFQRFLAVQLLWDETMADGVSGYLMRNPTHRMVVLAGGGHVDHADAVPGRVRGVSPRRMAMVTQTREPVDGNAPTIHALRGTALSLPAPGRLGVVMTGAGGGVHIGSFAPDSAGRDAGLEPRDRLLHIDGTDIDSMAALRLAMWRKRPGDLVDVGIARGSITHEMRFALR